MYPILLAYHYEESNEVLKGITDHNNHGGEERGLPEPKPLINSFSALIVIFNKPRALFLRYCIDANVSTRSIFNVGSCHKVATLTHDQQGRPMKLLETPTSQQSGLRFDHQHNGKQSAPTGQQ